MNTIAQLLLPALILPALFSFSLLGLGRRHPAVHKVLILAWLPSYLWINGVPEFLSRDATHWLWLVALLAAAAAFLQRRAPRSAAQTALLLAGLLTVVWPLAHLLTAGFALGLGATLLIGASLHYFADHRSSLPVTTTAVSLAGLGLVSAFGGSLLVGQLAIALAVLLSGFSLVEIFRLPLRDRFPLELLGPLFTLYLVLLLIGQVYADLPLGPVALLLIAPAAGVVPRWRYGVLVSAALAVAALAWSLAGGSAAS